MVGFVAGLVWNGGIRGRLGMEGGRAVNVVRPERRRLARRAVTWKIARANVQGWGRRRVIRQRKGVSQGKLSLYFRSC